MNAMSRRDAMKAAGASALAAAAGMAWAQAGTRSAADAARQEGLAMGMQEGFKDGQYVLPDLPYGYDALEPLYSEQTLRVHRDKHHAGYVKGLNRTLEQLAQARRQSQYDSIRELSRDLAFNGSGHMLHTLFWRSMTPGGAEMPSQLSEAIGRSFGSVDAFRAQFAAACRSVMSNGWGVLAYEPVGDALLVLQAERHQDLTVWGVAPLLVCDVWEHAYYLMFANERGKWVDNFMKLANWPFAQQRYLVAKG